MVSIREVDDLLQEAGDMLAVETEDMLAVLIATAGVHVLFAMGIVAVGASILLVNLQEIEF